MHYVNVKVSHYPEQWITHSFKPEEISEVFKLLRKLTATNTPHEHYFED